MSMMLRAILLNKSIVKFYYRDGVKFGHFYKKWGKTKFKQMFENELIFMDAYDILKICIKRLAYIILYFAWDESNL